MKPRTKFLIGGAIVLIAGYFLVGRHRRLLLDEILAGVALVAWTIVDRVNDNIFGGANPEMMKILDRPGRTPAGVDPRLCVRAKPLARRTARGLTGIAGLAASDNLPRPRYAARAP